MSRGDVTTLPAAPVSEQGEAVAITTRNRPLACARGCYRENMRHGASRLIEGHRHTLGIIFHTAA
ncbi:MAG: 2OG-Fe(II) oxygenase [Candidatus Rokubacteria bacterium]|nr:2OG-Fe(II) oxygenase [Candidatus Rokubacteria bacterium]